MLIPVLPFTEAWLVTPTRSFAIRAIPIMVAFIAATAALWATLRNHEGQHWERVHFSLDRVGAEMTTWIKRLPRSGSTPAHQRSSSPMQSVVPPRDGIHVGKLVGERDGMMSTLTVVQITDPHLGITHERRPTPTPSLL